MDSLLVIDSELKPRLRCAQNASTEGCGPLSALMLVMPHRGRGRSAGHANAYRITLQSGASLAEQSLTTATRLLDRGVGLRPRRKAFGPGTHCGLGLERSASND